MKKKILIFSLAYYPHVGGAEVAIKEITDRLPTEAFEFHLVANRYDRTLARTERVGNVLVHRIGFATRNPSMGDLSRFPLHINKGLYQFLAFFVARALHRKHRYDGIWAMMAHGTGVPAGLFKHAFPDVSYILTLQEGDPPEYIERKMAFFGPLFRRAFTAADVVQAISTFLAAWAVRMGYPRTPEVIPNAVDTDLFSRKPTDEDVHRVRTQLQIEEGKRYLITSSRLVHKNAIDDVIRALAQLPVNIHFMVLGEGPERQKLSALAARVGVSERVHFLGHVDRNELPAYLHACDIFVRPSRSEGLGISFLEAMAAGIPVIGTHEGGIPDFLYDSVRNPGVPPTGFVVDANAPAQIATAVNHILSTPKETAEVTHNARTLIQSKYTWNRVAEAMHERVFSVVRGKEA